MSPTCIQYSLIQKHDLFYRCCLKFCNPCLILYEFRNTELKLLIKECQNYEIVFHWSSIIKKINTSKRLRHGLRWKLIYCVFWMIRQNLNVRSQLQSRYGGKKLFKKNIEINRDIFHYIWFKVNIILSQNNLRQTKQKASLKWILYQYNT